IGGTRLRGGSGGVGGAIIGAIVLSLIQGLVFFAGVPTNAREFVYGCVIIAAIALAGLLTARAAQRPACRGAHRSPPPPSPPPRRSRHRSGPPPPAGCSATRWPSRPRSRCCCGPPPCSTPRPSPDGARWSRCSPWPPSSA